MSECRYVLIAILVADSPPRRHGFLFFFFFSARAAHVVLRTDFPQITWHGVVLWSFSVYGRIYVYRRLGVTRTHTGSLFKILPRNNALFTIVVTARYYDGMPTYPKYTQKEEQGVLIWGIMPVPVMQGAGWGS